MHNTKVKQIKKRKSNSKCYIKCIENVWRNIFQGVNNSYLEMMGL